MQLKDIEFKHIVLFAFLFLIGIYAVNQGGDQTLNQQINESAASSSKAIKGREAPTGTFSQQLYVWSCGGDRWVDCEEDYDDHTQECCLDDEPWCIGQGYDCSTGKKCGGDPYWCESGNELFCIDGNPTCFGSDINEESITKCGGWHACFDNNKANCVNGEFHCCPPGSPHYDSDTGGCWNCVENKHCSGDEVCENHKCRSRNYCERDGECNSNEICYKRKNECQKLDCDPGLMPKNHECVYGKECIKETDCMWCGTECVTAKDVYHCPTMIPLQDKVCTCSAGACTVEDKICKEEETRTVGCLNNETLKYMECKNNEWKTKEKECNLEGFGNIKNGELIPICKNSTCTTLTECDEGYKLTEEGCTKITIRDRIIRFFKGILDFLRGIFR